MAHDHERPRRDTVFGFGSLAGTVRLAELMLDASRPDSAENEIDLEGDAGFRGVAPASAELKLILPGSVAWPP
jgi:hypothetical protein